MGGDRSDSGSSSGEEDGNAEWRAAIDSVTTTSTFTNGFPSSSGGSATNEDEEENKKPQNMKHYQIKALKLLDDILDQTIEVVGDASHVPKNDPAENDAGIRLFKRAPCGIVFDHVDELQGPKRKPKIIPGEEIDEKSKRFRKQLQSVAIDGTDIIAAANTARQKSLAKLEAREAAAKAAIKREEERVEKLKNIRGERWLPSVARQMQVNAPRCN